MNCSPLLAFYFENLNQKMTDAIHALGFLLIPCVGLPGFGGVRISSLLYADDVVLQASSGDSVA